MRYVHRFVGTRRLERARVHINACIQQWSADWRVDHDTAPLQAHVEICADALQEFSRVGAQAMTCVKDAHGSLFVQMPAAQWRKCLFGAAHDDLPDDALAGALLAQAQQALLAGLAGNTAAPAALTAVTAESDRPAPGLPWIVARVCVGEPGACVVSLLIDARHFDDALPAPAPVTLISREKATGHATLRLQLHFALADVSATDLQHLKPGVVVQSSHRLDEPLMLGSASRPHLLKAFLGQRDGRLAARIAAKTTPVPVPLAGSTSTSPRVDLPKHSTSTAAERA